MVKQADIHILVPACSAQLFWDTVYEDGKAAERYHTSYNASSRPSASPWSAGQRQVSFHMPLSLPEFAKRMVGLDAVNVTEVQRAMWHGAGSFTVSSETRVANLLGASRFTTALQLTATEHPGPAAADGAADSAATAAAAADGDPHPAPPPPRPSLSLVYSVRCGAASVPWPLCATIENLMAEKALVSMQYFLDFAVTLLEEGAAGAREAGGAAAGAAAAAAAGGGESAAGAGLAAGSASQDLQRRLSRRWPSITCSHDLGGGGAMAGGPGGAADPWVGHGTLGLGPPAANLDGPAGGRRVSVSGASAPGGGGGEEFADAQEAFLSAGSAGSVSGYSSDGLSPRRPSQLPPGPAAPLLVGLDDLATGPLPPAQGQGQGQDVAAALRSLSAAVAGLGAKLDAVLLAQQRQEQEHVAQARSRARGGRRRWVARLLLALLLASAGMAGWWLLLHPHATGLRPRPPRPPPSGPGLAPSMGPQPDSGVVVGSGLALRAPEPPRGGDQGGGHVAAGSAGAAAAGVHLRGGWAAGGSTAAATSDGPEESRVGALAVRLAAGGLGAGDAAARRVLAAGGASGGGAGLVSRHGLTGVRGAAGGLVDGTSESVSGTTAARRSRQRQRLRGDARS